MRKIKITIILTAIAAFFTISQSFAQANQYEMVDNITCEETSRITSCLGEPVEGYIVYNVVNHTKKDGSSSNRHWNVKHGMLTGCNTGREFKVIQSFKNSKNINDNNDQEVRIYVNRINLIGEKGEKYSIIIKTHVTINANGDEVVSNAEFVSCQ